MGGRIVIVIGFSRQPLNGRRRLVTSSVGLTQSGAPAFTGEAYTADIVSSWSVELPRVAAGYMGIGHCPYPTARDRTVGAASRRHPPRRHPSELGRPIVIPPPDCMYDVCRHIHTYLTLRNALPRPIRHTRHNSSPEAPVASLRVDPPTEAQIGTEPSGPI